MKYLRVVSQCMFIHLKCKPKRIIKRGYAVNYKKCKTNMIEKQTIIANLF